MNKTKEFNQQKFKEMYIEIAFDNQEEDKAYLRIDHISGFAPTPLYKNENTTIYMTDGRSYRTKESIEVFKVRFADAFEKRFAEVLERR